MNGLPYYKAYPRDFIEGTIGMSFEVKAAYRLVLDLIYMQGGNLPDDARYISGLLGCTVRKWGSLRKALIATGKITATNGYLTNKRAVIEIETVAKFQEKQSENRRGSNKNKGLQKPRSIHTDTDTDTDIDGGGGSARAREADPQEPPDPPPPEQEHAEREQALVAMGHDPTGLTASGRIVGSQADMAEKRRWADLGLSHEQQIAVIREVMAAKRDGPPINFRYFTGAMQRLAGELARAPLAPAIPTEPGPPALSAVSGGRRDLQAQQQTERLKAVITAAAVGTTQTAWG